MASAMEDIKKWLLDGHTLTQKESTEMFGETRLSDKVYQLKRRYDLDIRCMMVEGTNRYGRPMNYGKYYIPKESRNG